MHWSAIRQARVRILAWLFTELLLGEQLSDQVNLITNTNISMDVTNVTLYESPKICDEKLKSFDRNSDCIDSKPIHIEAKKRHN